MPTPSFGVQTLTLRTGTGLESPVTLAEIETHNQATLLNALSNAGVFIIPPGRYPVASDDFSYSPGGAILLKNAGVSWVLDGRVVYQLHSIAEAIRPIGGLGVDAMSRQVFNSAGLIPAATYGDSRARLATANNNYSVLQPAVLGGGGISTTQLDRAGIAYAYPAIQWYGDGGVAGETLTDMITRETAASGATRKSLDDLASTGAKVLFFSAGINDIDDLGLVPSVAADPNVVALINRRKDLLYRALNRFQVVVDLGLYGYDPVSVNANTPYMKQALMYVEQQFAAFAASMNGRIIWAPLSTVVGDGAGGFKAGYADNSESDTLGVHLTVRGSSVAHEWLASQLEQVFGRRNLGLIKYSGGPNMLQNPDFVSTTSQSYGTLADGVTLNATGVATRSNAGIVTIDGIRYQVCTFTTTSATSSTCQIKLTAPIFGGSPTFPVLTNDVIGVEFNILCDDGSGGPPTAKLSDSAAAFNCQFQFQTGSGNRTYWFATSDYEKTPDGAVKLRVHSPRMVVPVDSASLTGIDLYFRYICTGAGVVRLGIGNPRLINLS